MQAEYEMSQLLDTKEVLAAKYINTNFMYFSSIVRACSISQNIDLPPENISFKNMV